ncbi:hypothetical protein BX600DRAFT_440143 [Xylariales sp. PMI_506]|nr:hypothetical protein BX600DRAFT_440143 [Xylariales sp. PMI_506]
MYTAHLQKIGEMRTNLRSLVDHHRNHQAERLVLEDFNQRTCQSCSQSLGSRIQLISPVMKTCDHISLPKVLGNQRQPQQESVEPRQGGTSIPRTSTRRTASPTLCTPRPIKKRLAESPTSSLEISPVPPTTHICIFCHEIFGSANDLSYHAIKGCKVASLDDCLSSTMQSEIPPLNLSDALPAQSSALSTRLSKASSNESPQTYPNVSCQARAQESFPRSRSQTPSLSVDGSHSSYNSSELSYQDNQSNPYNNHNEDPEDLIIVNYHQNDGYISSEGYWDSDWDSDWDLD